MLNEAGEFGLQPAAGVFEDNSAQHDTVRRLRASDPFQMPTEETSTGERLPRLRPSLSRHVIALAGRVGLEADPFRGGQAHVLVQYGAAHLRRPISQLSGRHAFLQHRPGVNVHIAASLPVLDIPTALMLPPEINE